MRAACAGGVEQTHYPCAESRIAKSCLAHRDKDATWPPEATGAHSRTSPKGLMYADDALSKAWPKLHAGDGELTPMPDAQALHDAIGDAEKLTRLEQGAKFAESTVKALSNEASSHYHRAFALAATGRA